MPLTPGELAQIAGAAGEVASPVVAVLLARRASRVGDIAREAIEEAIRESGLDADQIAARVVEDPRLEEIVATLIDEAGRTAIDDKLRLMRRVMARALLADDTELDEVHFLTMAAVALEVAHLMALRIMGSPRPGRGQLQGQMIEGEITLDELVQLYPGATGLHRPIISLLEREGLIEENTTSGWSAMDNKPRWAVSPYGRRLLDFLADEE